eukprot:209778-Amphidinium_carterae.1
MGHGKASVTSYTNNPLPPHRQQKKDVLGLGEDGFSVISTGENPRLWAVHLSSELALELEQYLRITAVTARSPVLHLDMTRLVSFDLHRGGVLDA